MQTQVIISQATNAVTEHAPLSPEEKLVVKELEENADNSSSSDSEPEDLNMRILQSYVDDMLLVRHQSMHLPLMGVIDIIACMPILNDALSTNLTTFMYHQCHLSEISDESLEGSQVSIHTQHTH